MADVQSIPTTAISDVALPSASQVSDENPVIFSYSDAYLDFTIPASARTHDGYRAWAISDDFPERGRFTFVDGAILVDMSPENLEMHGDLKTELGRSLGNMVREQRKGHLYVDGVLISHIGAKVSNEPDLIYLSKVTRKSDRVQLTPAKGAKEGHVEIVGSVDWVAEVVSPSSKRKDKRLLREAYFKAGIPEYWVVDVNSGEIEFDILVAADKATEYVSSLAQEGWQASPTFGQQFRLVRERDEDDFWLYTLESKPL